MRNIGVCLIQLGTPDAPTAPAVRRYLREFLSDPRVIEAQRLKWWFVLNLFILPRRSKESAEKYARIWDAQSGSPLLHITQRQCSELGRALPDQFHVAFGMRYGRPSIADGLSQLLQSGVDRVVVLPLYPQYSAASTGTACDKLFDALRTIRYVPALRIVPPFFDHPAYIRAQAGIVTECRNRLSTPPDKIVFSFHGYPVDFVQRGDPYQRHVQVTAQLLADELGLKQSEWTTTYQSRFGRQVWLEPYTEETLCAWARNGVKRVLVASPGFTTDCLETIDEIGREIAESFQEAGGEQLIRCPCLNDSPLWIEAMRQLVIDESAGWLDGNR